MNGFQMMQAEVGSAIDVSGVPNEVLLFPEGVVETTKYEPYTVDADSAARCIEYFNDLGRDHVIDYEHATLKDKRFEGNAPAAGWIKSLRWGDGKDGVGVYARVEWTARARQQIAAKEYRYLSPVYFCDPPQGLGRKLLALWQTALTNDPATIGAVPLVASRRQSDQEAAAAAKTPGSHRDVSKGGDRDERIHEFSMAIGCNNCGGDLDRLIASVHKANTWLIAPLLGLPETADVDQVRAALLKEFGEESASREHGLRPPLLRNSAVGMAVRIDAMEQGRELSSHEFYAEISSRMELQRRQRQADPDNGKAFYADHRGRQFVPGA